MRGHKSFFLKKVYFFALSPTENFDFFTHFSNIIEKKIFSFSLVFGCIKLFFVIIYYTIERTDIRRE